MAWHILCESATELKLSFTLICGQAFRWKYFPAVDEWVGVLQSELVRLRQNSTTSGQVTFWCESTDADTVAARARLLQHYFSLDTILTHLMSQWCQDGAFKAHTSHMSGLRLLRQDPVETLFAFICSSNNNIARITQLVNKLAKFYGKPVNEYLNETFYSFPSVEALASEDDSVEKCLRQQGFGYRAKFISHTARQLLSLGGAKWLTSLCDMPYEEAVLQLCQFPGVGRKVADCVCLHSLGFWNAIPVDTHIFQIAGRLYVKEMKGLGKKKALSKGDYEVVAALLREKWQPNSGWAQAVIFSSDLNSLKTTDENTTVQTQTVTTKKVAMKRKCT